MMIGGFGVDYHSCGLKKKKIVMHTGNKLKLESSCQKYLFP